MENENDRQTIAQFIERHGLTMEAVRIPSRVGQDRSDSREWDKTASHWVCTIRRGGNGTGKGPEAGSFSTFYSMGSAHKGKPKLDSVLDSLALDSDCAGESFESWCSDFGLDTDSRRAERMYRACGEIRRELIGFMGADGYRELLDCERL